MKTSFKVLLLPLMLLVLPAGMQAQFTFTTLHNFGATYRDGYAPLTSLVLCSNSLYGTTASGGTNGNGTIFKINTDGFGFSVIKTFSATFLGTNNVSGSPLASGTNADGAYPTGGLLLDGTTLYGTTYHGGTSNGVVFAMQTDGGGYSVLKYFSITTGIGTNSDGAAPVGGLALSGDTLYGAAVGGGAAASGNIFSLKTNGAGFTNLHGFSWYSDGAWPHTTLLLDGSTLYGTTAAGGISNKGTIFMVLTNGANFTTLKNFDLIIGAQCESKFVVSSNTLYGTAADGGTNGSGVIFGLTVLPQILSDGNFGVQANSFGFDFTGISNQTAIIEVSTNLFQAVWSPLRTSLLIGAPLYFSDSHFS